MTHRMPFLALGAALAAPASAADVLNAGPKPKTAFVTTDYAAARFESKDGRVVVQQDNILTTNCAGCETPQTRPGMLYHAYNGSAKAVCFSIDMTMDETRADRLIRWGAGEPHYLKPGKWMYRIAGITQPVLQDGPADLGWRGGIRVWEPEGAGRCGPPPA